MILAGNAQKGLISGIYKILNAISLEEQGKHSYMIKWEKTLNEELLLAQWQAIWTQTAKSSMCTLYKENSYKILFFWYMTADVLHTIFPTSSDKCWRCQGAKGTFMHIYWNCPILTPYWEMVQRLLSHLLEMQVQASPKFFPLGLSPLKLCTPYKKLLRHVLTAARCLIALNWKRHTPPSAEDLYSRIKDVELMEKMTDRIRDRLEAHNRVWELWHLWEDPP